MIRFYNYLPLMSLNLIIILLSIFNIYKPFLPSFFKFDNFQIFRILTLVIPFVHADTIFPGQIAFCKKAVVLVGLAGRRIF